MIRKYAATVALTTLGLTTAATGPALAARPAATAPHAGEAQATAPLSYQLPDGRQFTGQFTPTRFFAQDGQLMVTGLVTGAVDGTPIAAQEVTTTAGLTPAAAAAAAAPASCNVLNLVLGPLHLNLLGLVVDLNQVILNITAVPGAGNLVGNLLCAITNLLNGTGGLAAIVNLLNRILSFLG